MALIREEALADFVPAAVIMLRGQALLVMIGCKGFVGCIYC